MWGFLAGVLGGAVFLALSPTESFLRILGSRLGTSSEVLEVVFHLTASGALGVVFGLSVGCLARTVVNGLLFGTAYGMVLWILGSAVSTPWHAVAGPRAYLLTTPDAFSLLLAHMGYGMTTGLAFGVVQQYERRCVPHKRARQQST